MKNDQILLENHYFEGILSFLLFLETFWIQKCLEAEKRQNPLNTESARNGKRQNSFNTESVQKQGNNKIT